MTRIFLINHSKKNESKSKFLVTYSLFRLRANKADPHFNLFAKEDPNRDGT
jgi:hypothetical protein